MPVIMVIDIDTEFVRNALKSIDAGKGGCVALVTSDGKEFYCEADYDKKDSLFHQKI